MAPMRVSENVEAAPEPYAQVVGNHGNHFPLVQGRKTSQNVGGFSP